MSLTACPHCGYAVSTVTAQCRHCSGKPLRVLSNMSAARMAQIAGVAAIVATVVYFLVFR